MKRNLLLVAICLLFSTHIHALIVSVDGYGNIPESGMELTLTEAQEDPLTGEKQVKVDGTLLCSGSLTVTITRSAAGIKDEFCCAGECTFGNQQTEETLQFAPADMTDWYVHFTPTDSYETIVYTFTDGAESRVLTVHYDLTQGLDDVQNDKVQCTKFIKNGLLFIQYGDKIYNL